MKKPPAKKGMTRLPLILAGLFFLAWAVAVIFTVGETFSRPNQKNGANAPTLLAGPGGAGTRYPILDRNRRELAVSFPTKSVYARPLEVNDPAAAAAFLAGELGLDEQRQLREFREERGFFWLGRQIPEEAGQRIRAANLPGIYVVDESQRYYPQGSLAAHVVGFVDEGHGLAGIEAKYDRQLRGLAEPLEQEADAEVQGPLVLTLDLRAQELLEKQLNQLLRATSASGGCGMLLAAGSGEILALASLPAYDPNFFWEYEENARTNRLTTTGVPAAGFRNLFGLAAMYRDDATAPPDGEAKQSGLAALKVELKLSRLFGKRVGQPARLVRRGDGYLSQALADLEELEINNDVDSLIEELGMERRTPAETASIEGERPGRIFRPNGYELLAGLAGLLNPAGPVAPHLLAGVLDPATGQLRRNGGPVVSPVRQATVEKMRDFFRGVPSEGGGVKVLEELTAVPGGVEVAAIPVADRPSEEVPRFTTLLVALAGGEKSPPLLLLLALEQARLDPLQRTPMSLAAGNILPRVLQWAAEKPATTAWQPRENLWRAEWRSRQVARAGKSKEKIEVDRRRMPDLQGLSLRKALQVLNGYDLQVRVKGTGLVTRQEPKPGAAIDSAQCLLTLAGLK